MEQASRSVPEQWADGITVVQGKRSGSVHVLFMAAEGISGGIRKDRGVLRRGSGVFSSTDSEQQSGSDPRR